MEYSKEFNAILKTKWKRGTIQAKKKKHLNQHVIGQHAVQFGNKWTRNGRVQFGSQRNFSNSIISKLDSMLSYYVLIILYTRIKYG